MKRKFTKSIIVMMIAALMVLLGGCGSSFTTGTWYMEGNKDSYINFLNEGVAEMYDSDQDTVYVAEWTEKDGTIKMEVGSETAVLEFDGKGTLTSEDMGASFEQGTKKDVPEFTQNELMSYIWMQKDEDCELTFYGDNTWALYDNDESEYVSGGTYELDEGKLIMESDEDESYSPTLTQERKVLALDKELVFQIKD